MFSGRLILMNWFLLIAAVSFLAGANAKRHRRNQIFRIVNEESIPCSVLEKDFTSKGIPFNRTELTDDEKLHLFLARGGNFIPSLMAVSREAALLQFRERVGQKRNSDGTVEVGGMMTRGAIMETLKSPDRRVNESFPFVLPDEVGIKSSTFTTSAGTEVIVDYCLPRSNPVDSVNTNFLRMCSVCSTTTLNPPYIWPEMLSGVICNAAELGCLYDVEKPGQAHGRCFEESMFVNVMEKDGQDCILVLSNGETLVAENWVLNERLIHVSCSCAADSKSKYR